MPVQIPSRGGWTLTVRVYEVSDFGALVQMYKAFEPKRIAQGLPPCGVPRIINGLDRLQNRSEALVAVEEERIVAHAILCPISDASVEYSIFVHQNFRRIGLASALTRLAADRAKESGFAELYHSTELSNAAAVRLYHRAGFQITNTHGNECDMRLGLIPNWRGSAQAA